MIQQQIGGLKGNNLVSTLHKLIIVILKQPSIFLLNTHTIHLVVGATGHGQYNLLTAFFGSSVFLLAGTESGSPNSTVFPSTQAATNI